MKYFTLAMWFFIPQFTTAQSNSPKTLTIDYQLIKAKITQSKATLKDNPRTEKWLLNLLIPSGEEQRFEVEESLNFSSDLAVKYPEIQTYIGTCVDDKMLTVRFDVSPLGYSAIYNNHGEVSIIEPLDLTKNQYVVVPYEETQKSWQCEGVEFEPLPKKNARRVSKTNAISNGTVLKTLRTAIATTGEFTIANGGITGALARINSFLTVVNAVYMIDLAIKFELVNNTSIKILNLIGKLNVNTGRVLSY